MKVSFFIDRPVFSAVISIVIVIVGIIGLTMLPVDQYPQITPPVVKISASYPGASALTVSQAVATPIEQEINGTPGMLYMESNSSNSGGFSATVTFDVSADPDLAAVEIQNRVKLAESRLPAEVIQNGISVEKQAPSQLMTLCLTSTDPKFDEIYLSNFATINVLDVIRRIPGVGRVSNIGSRYYAMQIWAEPDKLANFGLTVQDLQNALKDQNRESAAGVLGQQPVQGLDITIPITTQGRLSTVGQFEDIVVRANANGSIIRLKDVARVSLEASSYNTESGINGENAAVLGIYMLPGANAMEVAENVKKAMEEISENFPEGLSYEIPFDMTTYISESIHEVYKTLFEALVLVVLVVYLSLQSWRATLIPVVAVPISLIGTFGFMLIFGFSINILTLLGLILAIGIVVDDAIVVVEGVEHIMETEKLSPYEATKKAMNGLSSALIATSLVLAAVFVPVSFLSGITGQLYRQFTVTIVVSVLISTVVALTLSPVMCSLILKPDSGKKKNIVFRKINEWLGIGSNKYVAAVTRTIKHPRRVLSAFGMVLIAILLIHRIIPTSFLPVEDQGYFKIELELPEGATLERTRVVTERAIAYLEKNPYIEYVQNVTGSSPRVGSNQGRAELTVILKPWEERKSTSIEKIMDTVEKHLREYPECKVYLSTPPVIPGLGSSGGFEMQLEGDRLVLHRSVRGCALRRRHLPVRRRYCARRVRPRRAGRGGANGQANDCRHGHRAARRGAGFVARGALQQLRAEPRGRDRGLRPGDERPYAQRRPRLHRPGGGHPPQPGGRSRGPLRGRAVRRSRKRVRQFRQTLPRRVDPAELPGHYAGSGRVLPAAHRRRAETRHEGRHPRHHRAVQQALTKPALGAAQPARRGID